MDTLSVAQLGLALQSSQTMMDIGAAVAKQNLDMQKQEGELAVQLIESAGVGTLVNTYA